MRILVAEDNLATKKLLETLLKKFGHDPVFAGNGREAWELLSKEDFQMVLADWMMPEMDGVTLCKKIRTDGSKKYIYIIMLTAKSLKDDIVEGLNAGANDYLTKPFHHGELMARIKAGEKTLQLEDNLAEKNRELQALNRRLKNLARVDALTQLGNRLALEEAMEKTCSAAQRYRRTYSIIMCDIDRFKRYNDTYGHPAGDKVLRRIADTLKSQVRASDQVFRYGGEEFAILLPEHSMNEAEKVAERLKSSVETLEIEHTAGDTSTVTISLGVATSRNNIKNDCRWTEVLKRADEALYEAKESGRNCIRTARED
ncbi:MAG: diguanylate cyclase [Planctomycetota bacterium]